jgi:hydroxymethylpyrimidine/phosphomethylpyrimidine kinase
VQSKNVHGTGCTYASAIATLLALELPVVEAVAAAKRFITEAIRQGLDLGRGHGPTNPYAAVSKGWKG